MSKRKTDKVSAVTGYTQQTSDIKKAKKSETLFFDEKMQISDNEFVRCISFSPEKKKLLPFCSKHEISREIK